MVWFGLLDRKGPDPYNPTTLFQSGFTSLACTAARGRGAEARLQVGGGTAHPCHVAHPPHAPLRSRGISRCTPQGLVYRGQGESDCIRAASGGCRLLVLFVRNGLVFHASRV